jgi:hypothetical protein
MQPAPMMTTGADAGSPLMRSSDPSAAARPVPGPAIPRDAARGTNMEQRARDPARSTGGRARKTAAVYGSGAAKANRPRSRGGAA